MARAWAGADARLTLPLSALLGAGILPVFDGLARAAFPLWGTELPVGALTALLGAPAFLVLLRRMIHRPGAV
ncbi:Fe(3+) dicitrate transport system permease protein FecC [compost metagenome]